MKNTEMENVLALLAEDANVKSLPIAERRRLDEENAARFPLPAGVAVEPFESGHIYGEWLRIENAMPNAAILYLHGGGYVFCSPATHRHLAAAIGQACGMDVCSLDYKLAPESPFPAGLGDSIEAYRMLLAQGISAAKIVIAGDSAGGGLTLATMIRLRERHLSMPAAGVLISPWTDLTLSSESCTTRPDPMVARERLAAYAQHYLNGEDMRHPLASPVFADLSGLPPLLIQVGTEEILYDDSIHIDARAKEFGVDSTLEIWDGMIHVWHYFHPMLTEGRRAIERIGEYVRQKVESSIQKI